jgi:hypothetical protein
MAKVTIHDKPQDTPSQAIVREANGVFIVRDVNGREIGIKKLNALERLKMLKVIGGFNDNALGYASLAFHVASIDGNIVNRPVTEAQVESIIQKLDDEGLNAVSIGIVEHFDPNKVVGVEDIKK